MKSRPNAWKAQGLRGGNKKSQHDQPECELANDIGSGQFDRCPLQRLADTDLVAQLVKTRSGQSLTQQEVDQFGNEVANHQNHDGCE